MDDDWELSAEDLDSLERDALQKISQRNKPSSASATHSSSLTTDNNQNLNLPPKPLHSHPSFVTGSQHFDAAVSVSNNRTTSHSHPNQAEALTQVPRKLLTSVAPKGNSGDLSVEQLPNLSVKFMLHASGNIAAKFSYDPVLVGAFRKIATATWNAKERLWMFPMSSLSSAETVLCEISGYKVEIERLDPLVQCAMAAATAASDLRERYDQIPSHIESKLLAFQRDGVRFALQHGGRVLLADEMGLGKTLQAIAISTCLRESWPVLVLTPSSLRLQWASMIQQWLSIPSSDIVLY